MSCSWTNCEDKPLEVLVLVLLLTVFSDEFLLTLDVTVTSSSTAKKARVESFVAAPRTGHNKHI